MRIADDLHLTYCTNIHAGNGLDVVEASVRRYGRALKSSLSPNAPFGIGLRLSGAESREILHGDRLKAFRSMLDREGLYVFTLNGFPYGPFHDTRVKDDVHRPDWRDQKRVRYTSRLARILALLLPDGMQGGISTSPLSYRPWLNSPPWKIFVRHLIDVTAELVEIADQTGSVIHLDIEPEPDGLLESSAGLVEFFNGYLLPDGAPLLARRLGLTVDEAATHIRRHIQACWDTCHVAVMYEEPRDVLERYLANDIGVGKMQISSAVKVSLSGDRSTIEAALVPFVEPVYLHQVIQRNRDGTFTAFRDLDDALGHLHDERADEWRIHFHVPVFLERFGQIQSTRDTTTETLALLTPQPFTQHLEIETYTWGVLPTHLKHPLAASIQREFEWVLSATLAANP